MLTRDDAITTVVKFSTPTTIQINDNGVIKDVPAMNVGTGFFMHRDDNNKKLFIITANHVAKDFSFSTVVEMIGQNNQCIQIPLELLKTKAPIVSHPTADLSAIEININVFNSLNSNVRIFGTSLIKKDKIEKISRDAELTSIGFPNGLGTGNYFEPLSFRSHPSSNIIKDFHGLDGGYVSDIFVLENPSCGGYSGCPVLDLGYIASAVFSQQYDTAFYGVMHGTISDRTGGKMAVVTPATYILDII